MKIALEKANNNFIFPNFNKSILNISATLSEFLGAPTKHAVLEVLKKELGKDYKNVVFLCFDGLGMHPLKANLGKNDFLMRHIKEELTSVFPSTTTNATATLRSANTPASHGWFAWSLYFHEIDKVIDLYRDYSHYDHNETVPSGLAHKFLPFNAYYLQSQSQYEINTVFPPFVKDNLAKNDYFFETLQEQFENINKICIKPGKQFIYSYNTQPDGDMHDFGVTSPEARQTISSINNTVSAFAAAHPDTLLIITADHGQLDVDNAIKIWEDSTLLSCLQGLPWGDLRAMMVKVKTGQDERFLKHMQTKYKNDVEVFSSKELIERGVFGGTGEQDHRLGDYVVIIKNKRYFRFCELDKEYKGLHTGLTPEEMLVPLIIIGRNSNEN